MKKIFFLSSRQNTSFARQNTFFLDKIILFLDKILFSLDKILFFLDKILFFLDKILFSFYKILFFSTKYFFLDKILFYRQNTFFQWWWTILNKFRFHPKMFENFISQPVLWIGIRSDPELFPGSGIICSGSGSSKNERKKIFGFWILAHSFLQLN